MTYAVASPKVSAARRTRAGTVSVTNLLGTANQAIAGRLRHVTADAHDNEGAFREEVRTWLAEHLTGDWAALRGIGGPGRRAPGLRRATRLEPSPRRARLDLSGWPEELGGRGLSLAQQVIFHEEYARADAPELVNHLGEQLLGPTLIEFGTDEQKERFLPGIRTVDELWCQGYSEPGAGSDLAAVSTRAVLEGDEGGRSTARRSGPRGRTSPTGSS